MRTHDSSAAQLHTGLVPVQDMQFAPLVELAASGTVVLSATIGVLDVGAKREARDELVSCLL